MCSQFLCFSVQDHYQELCMLNRGFYFFRFQPDLRSPNTPTSPHCPVLPVGLSVWIPGSALKHRLICATQAHTHKSQQLDNPISPSPPPPANLDSGVGTAPSLSRLPSAGTLSRVEPPLPVLSPTTRTHKSQHSLLTVPYPLPDFCQQLGGGIPKFVSWTPFIKEE